MGPVTVITGGASGIGFATARRVREAGGRLALLDIDLARCRRAADELGSGVAAFECDVVDEASLSAAASRVESELGPIGALVCGAGIPQVPGSIDAMPTSEWEAVLNSHLKGTFLTCRILGGRMIDRGSGVIVNIASVTAYAPGPTYAYAPSKAAIVTLTTILAVEWARKGVRVNAVAPGWTDTPFLTRKSAPGKTRDMTALANASPLGRLMRAEEIAEVIYFLLSPQSSAIVGCTLPCDGGFLASKGWAPYGGTPQS
jgi:NAD(P)-dependent dehydrogenase (short-subunit alcohol dehydrogenase family)